MRRIQGGYFEYKPSLSIPLVGFTHETAQTRSHPGSTTRSRRKSL